MQTDINFYILISFTGYLIAISMLHIALFAQTHERDYLFFGLYSLATLGAVASAADGLSITSGIDYIPIWAETLCFQFFHAGLILFTAHILDVKSNSRHLFNFSIALSVVVLIGMSTLFEGNKAIHIASAFSAIAFLFVFVLSVASYKHGSNLAKKYLFAITPLFITSLFHILAINRLLGDIAELSKLVMVAAIWYTTAISLFLSQKIRILREEHDKAIAQNIVHTTNLIAQSRYASLGETVGNITHQWKQPLNAIGAILGSIKISALHNQELSNDKLIALSNNGSEIIKHLAETIDTFYGFLIGKDNKQDTFCVEKQLRAAVRIAEYSLDDTRIDIKLDILDSAEIKGNPNEFTHALLNIILNAKDAFFDSTTDNPQISITVKNLANNCLISISDNAGGIKLSPPRQVFEMGVSTKEHGSGLGLYMTKNIIEQRFGGAINVENENGCAVFTIALPYQNDIATGYILEDRKNITRIKQLTNHILELEQIQQNLKQWESIFEHAHWAIAIHEPKNDAFRVVNKAFYRLYGYTDEDLKHMTAVNLFTTDAFGEFLDSKTKIAQSGHVTFNTTHKRKDGSVFPANIQVVVIKDEDGLPLFIVANIWDRTDELKTKDSLQIMGVAMNNTDEAIYLAQASDANFIYVNKGACTMLGYTSEELLSMNVLDIDPVYSKKDLSDKFDNLQLNKHMIFETIHRTKDGRLIPVEITSTFFERDAAVYALSTAKDITERKKYEEKLRTKEASLLEAQQLAKLGNWEITYPSREVFASDEARRIYELPLEEPVSYESFLAKFHPDDIERIESSYHNAVADKTNYDITHRLLFADGRIKHVRARTKIIFDDDGNLLRSIGTIQDITEQKETEQKIEFLTHHDILTELPNRLLAHYRTEQAIAVAKREKTQIAAFSINIDNFKVINDSLGYQIGNVLLKKVATRLLECTRGSDIIGKHSGDEFIMIAPSSDATIVAEKILSIFEKPFALDGRNTHISASIGIAIYPDDGVTFEELTQKADAAMHASKKAGGGKYYFYNKKMIDSITEELQLKEELKKAISEGQLELFYQPQIDLLTNQVIGAEALIRWRHPNRGMVPPANFIPFAEQSGLIVAIGEWVIREACAQAALWREKGIELTMAVNISALQFRQGNLFDIVQNALVDTNLPPYMLELELTESIMMHNVEKILDEVKSIKELGVMLSIDDFGTGYSSLAYLKRFAVDKLKIDQSFVRDITNNEEDKAIVNAIIQMAKNLGLNTIAEGVEDEHTLNLLKEYGCNEVQGYHFACPLEVVAFELFYKSFSRAF